MTSASIRVLQLLDLGAGYQASRSASALARDLGSGFQVETKTIGPGGDYSSAASAVTRLRRLGLSPADIVHTWGPHALAAAVILNTKRIHTPGDSPSARSLRWIRAVMAYRDLHVICPTATLHRTCTERGMEFDRCHLIRPGVDYSRIRRRRDHALRASLGFEDSDRVLLLAGESNPAAGHLPALWASAILHVLDPKYRVLAWGRGGESHRLEHFAKGQQQPKLLSVAEKRLARTLDFEDLLPAADFILATPVRPIATLPVSIAMAAALPIIATTSYTIGELLEDRHTALLAPPGSPRALARRVLDLANDTNLQWSISDMARTEAYEYFTMTRFIQQHREVYRQLHSNSPVKVAPIAPGAGMRFHGRG